MHTLLSASLVCCGVITRFCIGASVIPNSHGTSYADMIHRATHSHSSVVPVTMSNVHRRRLLNFMRSVYACVPHWCRIRAALRYALYNYNYNYVFLVYAVSQTVYNTNFHSQPYMYSHKYIAVGCPISCGVFTPIFLIGTALGNLYGTLFIIMSSFYALSQSPIYVFKAIDCRRLPNCMRSLHTRLPDRCRVRTALL